MAKLKSGSSKVSSEQDELVNFTAKIWEDVQERPARAVGVVAAVVGVLALALLVRFFVERGEATRLTETAAAVEKFFDRAEGADRAALEEELRGLATRYSSHDESLEALSLLGSLLNESGRHEEAAAAYEEAQGQVGTRKDFAVIASLGRAASLRLAGDLDGAAGEYLRLLEEKDRAVPRSQIMLEVAALREAQNQREEALTLYESVKEEYPDSAWSKKADLRLRSLGGQAGPVK